MSGQGRPPGDTVNPVRARELRIKLAVHRQFPAAAADQQRITIPSCEVQILSFDVHSQTKITFFQCFILKKKRGTTWSPDINL